jgi:hypothetical protein
MPEPDYQTLRGVDYSTSQYDPGGYLPGVVGNYDLNDQNSINFNPAFGDMIWDYWGAGEDPSTVPVPVIRPTTEGDYRRNGQSTNTTGLRFTVSPGGTAYDAGLPMMALAAGAVLLVVLIAR